MVGGAFFHKIVLTVFYQVPSLASPQGSVTILPTVLYLVTGALREAVIKPGDESQVGARVSCWV